MTQTSITITLKWRWWLKSYLFGVLLMARLVGREPNWDRVQYWIGKGIKFQVR
jgi:hypothetical protein